MAASTQNANLQQSSSNNSTGNPQQVGPAALQVPSAGNLQPANSQTTAGLDLLGQGNDSISLSSIAKTSTIASQTVSRPAAPTHSKTVLVYGGLGVIAVALLIGMTYGLLRQP